MKSMKKFINMSQLDKNKVVSESWSKLTKDQKKQYEVLAKEDKLRYQREMDLYEKRGWFKDKDGNDSRKLFK